MRWLTKLARKLGTDDPRTMDQRRADLMADLLLGRVRYDNEPLKAGGVTIKPPTVGVVVPVTTLLGLDETPGELTDGCASIPAEFARELAAQKGTLFYRLLTDPLGRILDVTQMGRYPSEALRFALQVRDGQCIFPNCTAPAISSDVDHQEPVPDGPTNADNLGHLCRRHHRGKTFGAFVVSKDADGHRWDLRGRGYEVADQRPPTGIRPRHQRSPTRNRCELQFSVVRVDYQPARPPPRIDNQ